MRFCILLGLLISGQVALTFQTRESKDNELTIIHTNDIHSHYDQSSKGGEDCTLVQIAKKQCFGGLARIKTKVDALRKEHVNSLLLDAGGQFQGTLIYTYYKGNITWEAMNLLKYDLMTIGNHEFDNGPENLARVAKHFKFPLVSSNVDASAHPSLGKIVKKYQLFPKRKLAVVGYLTLKAPFICNLGDEVKIVDPVIAVQAAVDEVRKLGYTRVIAVSHNGYSEDQEIAKKLKGVSLIVGGHSHTYLAPKSGSKKDAPSSGGLYPTEVANLEGKKTYIVQAYYNSRFLGHIDIKFGLDGYISSITGQPIDLNSDVAMDAKVKTQVDQWRKPIDKFSKEVLTKATEEFDRFKCHKSECSLGNFITDIILNNCTRADVAIINSGDIRASLLAGPITVGNVLTALPYGSIVVQIPLKGSRIWNLFESVFSRISTVNHKPVTSFIQASGFQISYRPGAPIFKKLLSVQVFDKKTGKFLALDQKRNYKVATINFVAKGGDNIIVPPVQNFRLLDALDVIVMNFMKKQSHISPPPSGRIVKV